MPEKNGLFYAFNLRFSYLNRQHVELLNKLENESASGRKTRTRIIMDALEEYFANQEKVGEMKDSGKYITEEQLENVKNEVRAEVYQDCMRMMAGNMVARNSNILPQNGEMNQKSTPDRTVNDEDDYDIANDEVVMSNIARWS